MPCLGQQFAVFVLAHLFASFFDYTAQTVTSLLMDVISDKSVIYHTLFENVHKFFRNNHPDSDALGMPEATNIKIAGLWQNKIFRIRGHPQIATLRSGIWALFMIISYG